MKELDHRVKLGQVVSKETKKKQTLEFFKTIHPQKGHTLFQIDRQTLEVTKAVYNLTKTYKLNWKWKKGDKLLPYGALITETGCDYVSALNAENAIKQWRKGKDGNKFTDKNPLKL